MTNYNFLPNFRFAVREDLKDVSEQFLPTQGEPLATGWDVSAAFTDHQSIKLNPGEWVKIPLGIRCFAPGDWWLELRPRSSTTGKKNIHALYGVIDCSFEGELLFCGQYSPSSVDPNKTLTNSLTIKFGEAIGQIIPVIRQSMMVTPISNEEFDILCKDRNAKRGSNGFGSTSK
jgi:dUTPase